MFEALGRLLVLARVAFVLGEYSMPLEMPLLRYEVQLNCLSGMSSPGLRRPSACPTASTSCGYFEFRVNGTVKWPIFECADQSVFMSEQDEDIGTGVKFESLCNHRPKCHTLSMNALNPQFMWYLYTTYHVHVESHFELRFCCSMNHNLLDKLIRSGKTELPKVARSQVVCNEKKYCQDGAVGCLSHIRRSQEPKKITVYDYLDVKPVEISFDDDVRFVIAELKRFQPSPQELRLRDVDGTPVATSSSVEEHHCVYPQLNNEYYRYCLMLHDPEQDIQNGCWNSNEHTVCCCFVKPNDTSCQVFSSLDAETTEKPSEGHVMRQQLVPSTTIYTPTTTAAADTDSLSPASITPTASTAETPSTVMARWKSKRPTRRKNSAITGTRRRRCRKKYVHESRFKSRDDVPGVKIVVECEDESSSALCGALPTLTLVSLIFLY